MPGSPEEVLAVSVLAHPPFLPRKGGAYCPSRLAVRTLQNHLSEQATLLQESKHRFKNTTSLEHYFLYPEHSFYRQYLYFRNSSKSPRSPSL